MKLELLKRKVQLESVIFIFLIIALLIFDRGFSKMPLIKPLYLHDFLLFLATGVAIHKMSVKIKFPSIFLLILIAFFYLAYSILFYHLKGEYFIIIFRQFFLFYYLACCYIIANKVFIDDKNIEKAIVFIKRIAKWSIALQLLYFIYLFATVPNYSPLIGFSYISSVAVMGIITFGAYSLVYYVGYKRTILFTCTLIISTLLGHSSSFFALFLVLLVHFYISFSPKVRFIIIVFLFICLFVLIQLPQFNDSNASWRLIYWRQVLRNSVFDNMLVFGNGFGKPYMTLETANYIAQKLNSTFMLSSVNVRLERWITPPHNSFLTMVHHIGLASTLLIFVPLKSFYNKIFLESKTNDKESLFLFYSLFGLIIWVSFNVILEMPHSAIYFWLIYFTFIFYEKNKAKI